MKKILFSLLLMAAITKIATAQQDAEYNMYLFNGLYLNPAYAGSQDVLAITGIYRHQWAGFEGAPRTVNVSVNSPLRREQYALGGTISNDRLGLTNVFSAMGAFAYRIKVGKKGDIISLGVQAGFSHYAQRNTEAILKDQNVGDPTFSINQSLFLPNIGAGVYAYGKRYFVGFSVPHMIPWSLNNSITTQSGEAAAKQYNTFLLTGGYLFGKDAAIVKFRPSILMKYQQGLRFHVPDFDINMGFLFINRLWLIGGLRTGGEAYNTLGKTTDTKGTQTPFNVEGVIIMAQAKVTPQLSVGYAYHYSLSALRSYETGTHEIMVGYDFSFNKKRFVTPRFVKYF